MGSRNFVATGSTRPLYSLLMRYIFAQGVCVFVVCEKRTWHAPMVWSVDQSLHFRTCKDRGWFVMLCFTKHRGCARALRLATVDVLFWLPMQNLLAKRRINIRRGFLPTSATRKRCQTGTNLWGSFVGGISRQPKNAKHYQRQNVVDGFQGSQTTPALCPRF
jgi:hypothetical protein